MAGIGFELRRMLRKNTLTGLLQAYAYAGAVSNLKCNTLTEGNVRK